MATPLNVLVPGGGPGGSGGPGPSSLGGAAPGRGRSGGGGWGPSRVDPADRAQLRESPVEFSRIVALFRPHKLQLLIVTIIVIATSIAGLANPFLIREIIDVALPEQDLNLLVMLVVGMVVVAALTAAFGVIQTWIASTIGERVMHTLRTKVFSHLQRQSMSFFTSTRSGEVTSRLTNDIGGMQAVVTTTATSIATNVTTVIATAIAMVALSWQLSLFTLVVLPPAVWLTRRVAILRRELTLQQQRRMAELTGQIDEGLSVSGALLTKTMGAEARTAAKFADTSSTLVDLALRSELAGRWRMAAMSVIFAAIPALIYLVAGLPITGGSISIGTLIAFATLQAAIFRPMMGLLNVAAQWIASMALFSRIFGYLDTETDVPEPTDPVEIDPDVVRGEVRFSSVTYRYAGADGDALSDITLTVPAGGSLALVGATGSGKSTLASMVARLRDPNSGAVTIDGIDLRAMAAADVARLVGVVTQETFLMHGTIADNLRFAKPEASEADLMHALEIAQIADHVAGLPDGVNTVVGARGHRFSGGEQQRLAIARVVLRDPKILVLDEATSALDNTTECKLQAALDALSRGRTTITIAHRLSTIAKADQIAVLDDGRIVELGSDAELRTRAGAYAVLAGEVTDPEPETITA